MENNHYQTPEADVAARGTALALTEEMQRLLRKSRPWAIFVAIMGFIFAFLMLIGGLGVMAAGGMVPQQEGMPISMGFVGFLYLIMGAVYFYPSYCLLRLGLSIGKATENSDQDELLKVFKYLRRLTTFVGILTLLSIVFTIGVMIFGAAAFSAGMSGI